MQAKGLTKMQKYTRPIRRKPSQIKWRNRGRQEVHEHDAGLIPWGRRRKKKLGMRSLKLTAVKPHETE